MLSVVVWCLAVQNVRLCWTGSEKWFLENKCEWLDVWTCLVNAGLCSVDAAWCWAEFFLYGDCLELWCLVS